ncbi:MAG: acyl-CoA dehydratase activase [Spirochaetes bacterium]|jgi:predicted CoA-substrate-specific enzyme activase|nr:acyl-CoA dehydratase activase [Spirochaetota bacterium]
MITAGIDIGSITAKAVVMSDDKIAAVAISFTGYNAEEAGKKIFNIVLSNAGLEESAISGIVSTGYGRNSVKFAGRALTEIICHGAGARFLNPDVRTVIDVGGQDSKAILLDSDGKVKEFVMNDKCAAGTGRFLEVMARALEVDLEDFGRIAFNAEQSLSISSICTVFAESEVISLISKGEPREKIIAGIHESVAARVSSLVKRIGVTEPVMMTGGVAKNLGAVRALEEKLNVKIIVEENAQYAGAIGAAVMALQLKKNI